MKYLRSVEAVSYGVQIFNRLTSLLEVPGKPLSVSSCFLQGKKVGCP